MLHAVTETEAVRAQSEWRERARGERRVAASRGELARRGARSDEKDVEFLFRSDDAQANIHVLVKAPCVPYSTVHTARHTTPTRRI